MKTVRKSSSMSSVDDHDSDEDDDDAETAEDFDAFKKWLNQSVSEGSPGTAKIIDGKLVLETPPAKPAASPSSSRPPSGSCQLCGKAPGVCCSLGINPKESFF